LQKEAVFRIFDGKEGPAACGARTSPVRLAKPGRSAGNFIDPLDRVAPGGGGVDNFCSPQPYRLRAREKTTFIRKQIP